MIFTVVLSIANVIFCWYMYRLTQHRAHKWNTRPYMDLMGPEWVDNAVAWQRCFGYIYATLAVVSVGLLLGLAFHALFS